MRQLFDIRSANQSDISCKITVKKLVIGATLLLIILIGLSSILIGADTEKLKQFQDSLLKMKAETEKVSRFEIYYYSWSTIGYSSITKEDLLKNAQIAVVGYPRRGLDVRLYSAIEEVLSKCTPQRFAPKDLDFRLACIIYGDNGELLRVFISKDVPAMCINDDTFYVNADVVQLLMDVLPYKEHNEMQQVILSDWATSTKAKPKGLK